MDLSAFLVAWRDRIKLTNGVRIVLDVAPEHALRAAALEDPGDQDLGVERFAGGAAALVALLELPLVADELGAARAVDWLA